MKKFLILPFLLLSATVLFGQTFEQASTIAMSDLKKAEKELSDLRKTIEKERIPLAKELSKLETEALTKRKEADRSKTLVDSQKIDVNQMENRIEQLRENNNYLSNQLGDYVRRFETNVHVAEQQLYQDKIDVAKQAAENSALSDEERFAAQLGAIETAFERLDKVVGGYTFEGSAVLPGGSYESGTFAIVGPIAYFSSASGDMTGLAEVRVNSANAVINDIGEEYRAGIKSLTQSGSGTVPLDATLGDASLLIDTKDTIVQHIKKGGVVMYPILGLASFAFIVAIFKWFEIGAVRRARPKDLTIILEHLKAGDKDQAMAHAKSVKGPVGEMLVSAVNYSDGDTDLLEEVLYEKIITTQPNLERMLPLIAVTAATAPLLGLLGTVTGMIKTFKLITVFGTGDASNLASGISEALITTEFGLIIAIPSLILHALLSRMAKGVIASMEQTAVGFINGVNENKK